MKRVPEEGNWFQHTERNEVMIEEETKKNG